MKAEIISIGTELLLGEIVDTNSNFIANQLHPHGIDLLFISTVGDNQQRLVRALEQAWQRSEIIITTGGLGPTQDDITREAIAELLHEELTIDPDLVQELKKFFHYRKLDMPKSNIKQASVIPSAQAISNNRGTAPGWWVEREGRIIIAMPGPPHEMQQMWIKEIYPKLKHAVGSNIILSRTLKTFGLGEAKIDELVSTFLQSKNPTLATYAKPDGIHLRITAKASKRSDAEKLITQREAAIREVLNDYIWGIDSGRLEDSVGMMLTAKGLSLATIESDTGGLLANNITNVPESSTYYKGGLIAYSNEAKIAFGIDVNLISRYGSISSEVAEAMAITARNNFKSDIGIGITGVMESTKMENKSPGTIFFSIDDGNKRHQFARHYPGERLQVKQRAVTSALFELQKILTHGGNHAPDY